MDDEFSNRKTDGVVCAVVSLASQRHPSAQVSTGRIDAAVADSTGAVLPGVTVDISGPQNQSAVTDALGEAHFLNLDARHLHRRRRSSPASATT